MKTPKKYEKMLNENSLTDDVIGQVIFSISKRAKNYRDKAREYAKSRSDIYSNFEKYKSKKDDCYQMKDALLELYTPCIIYCSQYAKRRRIYDYQKDYHGQVESSVYEHSYWDREIGIAVDFIDILVPEKVYYLYYEIGDYSFHRPIDDKKLKNYEELPIQQLDDNFEVAGKDSHSLLSLQFCRKVYQRLCVEKKAKG